MKFLDVVWSLVDLPWGDLATWVAAIAAVIGSIGTLGAFYATWRLLRAQQEELKLQRAELERQQHDRRKEQARQVAAWCADWKARTHATSPTPSEPFNISATVTYRNGSNEPVYTAVVVVFADWAYSVETQALIWIGIIPPNHDHTELVDAKLARGFLENPPTEIVFTDSSGLHWRRHADGKLQQLGENPYAEAIRDRNASLEQST